VESLRALDQRSDRPARLSTRNPEPYPRAAPSGSRVRAAGISKCPTVGRTPVAQYDGDDTRARNCPGQQPAHQQLALIR
jgi:hypothetical protein